MVKILKRLKNSAANEQGFTLIEILIASALLILSIIPMISLMEMSTITQRNSNLAITANNVANEEMEAIKGTAYDSIGLNVAGADPTGTLAPTTVVTPPSAVSTTYTITRQISWHPSTTDKQAKKVTIAVYLPGETKALASLTTYLGPTGVLPFAETPAETVTPGISLIFPTSGTIITNATPVFTASASDPSPGRILMVKYFLRNLDATESVNYGYRLSLYSDAVGYQYPSTLDAFNIIEPEPPLPDGRYAVFGQAIDINANSANSAERNIYLKVPPTIPASFTGERIYTSGTLPGLRVFRLTWNASQTNDGVFYKIYREINKGDITEPDYLGSIDTTASIVTFDDSITADASVKYVRYKVRSEDKGVYALSSDLSGEVKLYP